MAETISNKQQKEFIPKDLLQYFREKYPEFKKDGRVEISGQELAEDLATELKFDVESVLRGDLNINPEKKYLIRKYLNNGGTDIKIATPENPENGQLITSYGTFTTHAG